MGDTLTHQLAAIREIAALGLDAFCERYHINATRAGGLVSLKYNQAESPMHEECVADCRGLVVSEADPTHVVAMAYRKFWNLGEKLAASIDWSTARVMEKLDGSLITMHWHDGRWCVASSGHPTAGGPFNGESGRTFGEAFWDTWRELGYSLPEGGGGAWFIFEFCAPTNRIVVKYDRPRIVLHGVRGEASFEELSFSDVERVARSYGWECVASWPVLTSASAVVAAAALTDPLALEGFVVVDANHNRVKVKNPRYVEIHHLRGNRSPRAVVELWKAGEVAEVLAHFPEMRQDFDTVIMPLEAAIVRVGHAWERHAPIVERKAFAMQVKDLPFASALFKMHTQGGGDPNALIREMNASAILKALGLKEAA
jgi:hypothetical protein